MQGRDAEAEAVLLKLHANPGDPNHDAAKAEFYQIQKQIAIDKTLGSSWMHIIKKPSYRKRALLAIGITGIIQCSGVLGTSFIARVCFTHCALTTSFSNQQLRTISVQAAKLFAGQAAPISSRMVDFRPRT